jgi:hypothetical protein
MSSKDGLLEPKRRLSVLAALDESPLFETS